MISFDGEWSLNKEAVTSGSGIIILVVITKHGAVCERLTLTHKTEGFFDPLV